MQVHLQIPDHAALLEAVLDGLITAGALIVESGAASPGPPSDFQLVRDPDERWQLPDESEELNSGDCEDVVIWRAASLRASGR